MQKPVGGDVFSYAQQKPTHFTALAKTASIKNKLTYNTTIYLLVEKKLMQPVTLTETRSKTQTMAENNAVLIGRKPSMNYVLACITLFHSGTKEVSIKARGKAITRAIDVTEIIRRRFLPNVKITQINIGTDQITQQEDNNTLTNVSTIEIKLQR